MRKLLLKICYDGTAYCGWQVQPNGVTVQQKLCEALFDLLSVKTDVTGCSRTDSGVHANEFYCHFITDNETITNKGFVGALNVRLPNDISVLDCFNVCDDFHARYDALGKQYQYKFYLSDVRNPFLDGYALRIHHPICMDAVREFCDNIVGTHDFAAFSASGREYESTVRTITECKIEHNDNMYTLSVTGDGFLYNMVRIIAGTALAVSEGRILPQSINTILEQKNRALAGATLSPHGLYLNKVFYKEGALTVGRI